MKSDETGVLNTSDLYFSSPSPTAKRLYYYPIVELQKERKYGHRA